MWHELSNNINDFEEQYDYSKSYKKYVEVLNGINILPKDYPWMNLVAELYDLQIWNEEYSLGELQEKYLNTITARKNLNHVPSDIALYIFMLLELYRQEFNLTRKNAIKDFIAGDIFNYLADNFAILHTEANKRVLNYIIKRIERANILEGEIVEVKDGHEFGYENCKVVIIKKEE